MSKFIKVTGKLSGKSYLQNISSIESISDNEIEMKSGVVFDVKESVEEIEAQLLRDEFAVAAMSGFMSGDCSPYETANWIATYAYDQADAMLKERLK